VQQQFVQQQAIVLAVATALQRGNNSQIFGVTLSFILSQCGVRMRQKRRLWQQARLPGLWLEMKRIWPRLPQGMEDEKYYCNYRMHKAAFDKLLSLVAGVDTGCMSVVLHSQLQYLIMLKLGQLT